MSLSFLRPTLLLVLVAGLTACGGKAEFDVAGTITGLEYDGLVLTNNKNGDTTTVTKGATSFKMPTRIEYGTEYDVAVKTQPAHQTCGIPQFTAKDTAGRLATINIPVSCAVNQFAIGGKVTGLTVAGLVLANAGDEVTVPKDATAYTFPTLVPYNNSYTVGVLTNPPGLKCTVVNSSARMGDAAVTNIDVTCVPV